jgi:hypothetical protein
MRYLKNIWKMKNNSTAGQKKSLGSDRTFNNESSSENECSSTDKRASFTSLLGLNRTISSDSEGGSRIFLFSYLSLGKDKGFHSETKIHSSKGRRAMIAFPKFKISKEKSLRTRNSNHNFKESEQICVDNFLNNTNLYNAHVPLEIDLSLGFRAYNMSMYRL